MIPAARAASFVLPFSCVTPAAGLMTAALLLTLAAALPERVVAQTPTVNVSGEAMRLASWSVTPTGGSNYDVTLRMADDNNNGSLPNSFRRWWHCEIAQIAPTGVTLTVTITNAGYTDIILPTWARSTDGGQTFTPYTRMPTSAVPTRPTSTSHRFTITTPAGVDTIRIAKFFPYTVARKNAYLASLATHPHVRSITTIGNSVLGRPIEMVEITDASVPDSGKERVWIHTAVHPAETTAFFQMEGLIDWLGSSDPDAEALLDRVIFDIVPMANPDGVWLGNYRTNANSVNLENEWTAPYNSPQPEIVAMRTQIEGFMGTPAAPGSNPIRVVLNLHATHNVGLPFHFRHTSNPNWSAGGNNSGVIPAVHALENDWIQAYMNSSAFVAMGTTQNSSAGAPSRPFVESMMHDRWSANPQWTGSPAFEDEVMAITFEGTYRFGPTPGVWGTEADWYQTGVDMGRAFGDYFDFGPLAIGTSYGSTCMTVLMNGALTPLPNGDHRVDLAFGGATPNGIAFVAYGFLPATTPLPAPWQGCLSLTSVDAAVLVPVSPFGVGLHDYVLPYFPGFALHNQVLALGPVGPSITIDTSNGFQVRNL